MTLPVRIRMATVTTKYDANEKVKKTSKGYLQWFSIKANQTICILWQAAYPPWKRKRLRIQDQFLHKIPVHACFYQAE